MKTVSQLCVCCVGALMSFTAVAQVTESTNYLVGASIPDNNPSGLAVTATFSSSEIYQITDLEVSLNIAGGFNGDYYAYLTHGSGISVLLNRPGRDTGSLYGYPDGGLDVMLDDEAGNGDIHVYQSTVNPDGGVLTGSWAPDARNVDPALVLTSSPRSAFLNSFDGLNPNGDWTLFIADLDPGSSGMIQDWGLNVTGVPEPSTGALLLVGAGLLLRRRF